jgi:hypothetical protein
MSGPHDPNQPQYPQDPNYPPPGSFGGQQQPGAYPGAQYPGHGGPPPSGPYGPQYPTQQFPAPGFGHHGTHPGPPPAAAPRPTLWQRLGARATRRPAPRFGVTLTGVGVVLVVAGIVVWGFTYVFDGVRNSLFSGEGAGGSDSRHFLGFALALILVAIGYALVVLARTGPLVTAGVAATALGIPVAMQFATLDLSGGQAGNTDAIVWVSVIAYLISYFFVRGARGHTFYLGLSALLVWEYAVAKAGPDTQAITSAAVGSVTGNATAVPSLDTETIAAVSLIFAIAYYLTAWYLDRTGRRGMALPFVVVGIPAMLVGIGALAPDTKQLGTGIILLLVGIVLSRYGAAYERRFTAWFWALVSAGGAVTILAKFATAGTSVGIGMIVLGVVFAAVGWFAAKALNEPDDMATAPSPDTAVTAVPPGAHAR